MIKKLNSNRGDTLVEVLIALAALSAIIGFTYTTTTRAQKISQLNQDRASAVKFAESQVELIRAKRDAEGIASINAAPTGTDFCVTAPTPATITFNAPASNPACALPGGIFRQRVEFTPATGSASGFFRVVVEWDNYTSNDPTAIDQVQIVYRLQ